MLKGIICWFFNCSRIVVGLVGLGFNVILIDAVVLLFKFRFADEIGLVRLVIIQHTWVNKFILLIISLLVLCFVRAWEHSQLLLLLILILKGHALFNPTLSSLLIILHSCVL